MAMRVAINGFGRIGRCVLRAGWSDPDIEFVHVNDLTSPEMLAYLLNYDSVHGTWDHAVSAVQGGLQIGDRLLPISAEPDPSKLPWKGIDVVLECTGLFTSREKAGKHLDAGAGRVVISAPAKNEDITVCMGVNDHRLEAGHRIISNASCTTNCLAPVAKVLNDRFGMQNGLMTTVHSYTMDQNLLDAPHRKGDFRRARAAALSMVPTSTGAAKAVGLVLPELAGRLNGQSIRVPTPNVSLVDLVFTANSPLSVDGINGALREAAEGPLRGILQVSDAPIVSTDLCGNPHSSIVDLPLTQVSGGLGKVLAWYDNEWGFSNRMLDLVRHIAKLG